jgi:NAD(P) transhydrogenase subunit beta
MNNDMEELKIILNNARKIIIIPGYGAVLAQAQYKIKELADKLIAKGTDVKFAVHPLAGRVPAQINTLLVEGMVNSGLVYDMEIINPEFWDTDLAIIIGANDIINPEAISVEGTPIYGMPILRADMAGHLLICNYDMRPGYTGADNPIFYAEERVKILLGDAIDTLEELINLI